MFIFIVGHICDDKAMLLSLSPFLSLASQIRCMIIKLLTFYRFGLRKPRTSIIHKHGLVKFHKIVCPWSSCLLLCLAICKEMSSKYAVYMSIEYLTLVFNHPFVIFLHSREKDIL